MNLSLLPAYRLPEPKIVCANDHHALRVFDDDIFSGRDEVDGFEQCLHCGRIRLYGWGGWTDWFDPEPKDAVMSRAPEEPSLEKAERPMRSVRDLAAAFFCVLIAVMIGALAIEVTRLQRRLDAADIAVRTQAESMRALRASVTSLDTAVRRTGVVPPPAHAGAP